MGLFDCSVMERFLPLLHQALFKYTLTMSGETSAMTSPGILLSQTLFAIIWDILAPSLMVVLAMETGEVAIVKSIKIT